MSTFVTLSWGRLFTGCVYTKKSSYFCPVKMPFIKQSRVTKGGAINHPPRVNFKKPPLPAFLVREHLRML